MKLLSFYCKNKCNYAGKVAFLMRPERFNTTVTLLVVHSNVHYTWQLWFHATRKPTRNALRASRDVSHRTGSLLSTVSLTPTGHLVNYRVSCTVRVAVTI